MSPARGAAGRPDLLRLIDRLDIIAEPDELDRRIAALARPSAPTIVSFVNAHAVNLAWADPAFADELAGADVLFRDGAGLYLLLRRLMGRDAGLNLNGTDLIGRITAAFAGRPAAVLGTRAPFVDRAVEIVRGLGPAVEATADGFQDEAFYLDLMRRHRCDLILLGMGMPKQERVAARLRAGLDHPCLIVNGGAILDFWAGRFPRAPAPLRRAGLEWAYRLALEPGRLWRRYLLGNALFLWRGARLARTARRP